MHDYTVRLLNQERLDQFDREAAGSRRAALARQGGVQRPRRQAMRLFAQFLRNVHLAQPAKP